MTESALPERPGETNSLLRMVDSFADAGDELQIIAPRRSGGPRFHETPGGHRVRVRGVTSLPLAGYHAVRMTATSVGSLRQKMLEFAPDVVHLVSPTLLGGRAATAAEQLGLPTVAVHQRDVPGYTAKYGLPILETASWQLLRDVLNRATLTLAPSTHTAEELTAHGIQRVALWRRGVDTEQFRPGRRSAELRATLAEPDEKIALYAGSLAPGKQVADLQVIQDIPGVRLVIVGDGPELDGLRRRIPGARFVGFRTGDDLAAHIASADVFVHPGELETFCQGIQQAMACGIPAIAPRRGGPVDLIAPSRNGWMYTPGMLDELREAACDLLFDDAKREAFGAAALESVRRRTWPVIAEQLRSHYRRAIAMQPAGRSATRRSAVR